MRTAMLTCQKNVVWLLSTPQIKVAQGCNVAQESLVAQRHVLSKGQKAYEGVASLASAHLEACRNWPLPGKVKPLPGRS